jgi:hypothetical protein
VRTLLAAAAADMVHGGGGYGIQNAAMEEMDTSFRGDILAGIGIHGHVPVSVFVIQTIFALTSAVDGATP